MNRRSFGVISLASVACLALASCGNKASERKVAGESGSQDSSAESAVPSMVTATLSCRVNGAPISVAACFSGESGGPDGSLKIKNGGEVKQYSIAEIYSEMNRENVSIRLQDPYTIEAQGSGNDSYVIRLEIQSDGKVVFQDEASGFGVVSADSGQ